jgi:release factor glutamine methyltransferase
VSDSLAAEIGRAASLLAARGVENALLDAEVLLADVLGFDRARLFAARRRSLDDRERRAFDALLARRARREPLQHVRGVQEFFSREFFVDRRVLVPRPETELLVEVALDLAGPFRDATVLDLGCGCGVVAITIALELPGAAIFASDVSSDAVEVARENARRANVADRIGFGCGDLFAAVRGRRFDLVVSNPPYVPRVELERLAPEVRDYEPRIALDGGGDGLDFYRRLAPTAGDVLAEEGAVVVEIGHEQGSAVTGIFAAAGFRVVRMERDLAGIERVLVVRRG